MTYLLEVLSWPIDKVATSRLLTLCPSRDGTLCWFFVWMPKKEYSHLQFKDGVFDLRSTPIGVAAMALPSPHALHVEVDLNWATNGWDVDALVEEIDGKWWTPDCTDEVEFTRRLFRLSHGFQQAFNLSFVPCIRRRFRPHDGHTWIIVMMTRTERHAQAIRARCSDVQGRMGLSAVTWTLPEGAFQLVKFDQAVKFWSKIRMDTLSARAATDLETKGRRLFIGDIHEGVLAADLDGAISNMGYNITTPTEIISRHWGCVAYITLASNDEAVDLIMRSDSITIGDPPCRLRIKVARPRDAPSISYPPEDAFPLLDKQPSIAHGDAHGMTDVQVASVVDALQTIQESVLKATIDRLTGAATGLPGEFQKIIDTRLTAIQSAIVSSHEHLAGQLANLQATVTSSANVQESRIQGLTATLHTALLMLTRLTTAQDQADSWGEAGLTSPRRRKQPTVPPPPSSRSSSSLPTLNSHPHPLHTNHPNSPLQAQTHNRNHPWVAPTL